MCIVPSRENVLPPPAPLGQAQEPIRTLITRMRKEGAGRDYFGVPWVDQLEAAVSAGVVALPSPQEKDVNARALRLSAKG